MKMLVITGLLLFGFGGIIVSAHVSTEGNTVQSDDKIYSLKEVDTPAKILKRPAPKVLPKKGCLNRNWIVMVKIVFLKSGEVGDVTIHNPPNPPNRLSEEELKLAEECGVTQSVLLNAKEIKFKPAIKDGQPVSQYAYYRFDVKTSSSYQK